MNRSQQPTSRREMLRTSARRVVLGGIAVISGGLIVRTAALPGGCRRSASCRGSEVLSRCTHGPAMAAKSNSKR